MARFSTAFSSFGAFASRVAPVPLRALGFTAVTLVSAVAAHKRVAAAWVPTSDRHLEEAEVRMFEKIRTPVQHLMIKSGDNIIHTVVADAHGGTKTKPVIVLVTFIILPAALFLI